MYIFHNISVELRVLRSKVRMVFIEIKKYKLAKLETVKRGTNKLLQRIKNIF